MDVHIKIVIVTNPIVFCDTSIDQLLAFFKDTGMHTL